MPAMLEDPTAPAIYRNPADLNQYTMPVLPDEILPRCVTLRDRQTNATIIPFNSPDQVPYSLLAYLCDQLNREIEKGDTYPHTDALPLETFGPYWFANFGAVMVLGELEGPEDVRRKAEQGVNWDKQCLGSFYIKPNYPGRSSHICNGGFLVTDGARNRGVGRLMGESYLEWAPKLGYTYSVFNLVYETNTASQRIWDTLGFKRIGRVKGAGHLRSQPEQLIDAIIYGRELGGVEDEQEAGERFEKIRQFLKYNKYPANADRPEKSRLRSAATHYKLIDATDDEPEKLMMKDKVVIIDHHEQYTIARHAHESVNHVGINKTTAKVAELYHWVRIKDTVSLVIKNCLVCSQAAAKSRRSKDDVEASPNGTKRKASDMDGELDPANPRPHPDHSPIRASAQGHPAIAPSNPQVASVSEDIEHSFDLPVDPQIMEGIEQEPPSTTYTNYEMAGGYRRPAARMIDPIEVTKAYIAQSAPQAHMMPSSSGFADRSTGDIHQQLLDAMQGHDERERRSSSNRSKT